ncbi:hypothetical protein AB0D13_33345 [Streptomyces sp. NPDC048430]|uniref:hypothetical protein n=1 Tax=Streptomyces sp. NPDC048430 TaxID=3155388 RepID=UPI003418D6F9
MSIDPAEFTARLRAEQNDPDREETLRRERAGRRRKAILGAGAGLLIVGAFGVWLADAMSGGRPASEPFAPRMLDERMWPDSWPATTNMPFRGSPASAWELGSGGIRVPDSKAVGGLSEGEVSTGLGSVRDFLIATNLSDQNLFDVKPVGVLDSLPLGDTARRELEEAFTGPDTGREVLDLLTRFDRDEVQVWAEEGLARTRGTMTYEATVSGELLVHADYTFVYVLMETSGAKEISSNGFEVSRVVIHRQLDVLVRRGQLYPRNFTASIVGDDCTASADGFVHPLFYDDREKTEKWAPVDPYDESHIAPAPPGTCVRPART